MGNIPEQALKEAQEAEAALEAYERELKEAEQAAVQAETDEPEAPDYESDTPEEEAGEAYDLPPEADVSPDEPDALPDPKFEQMYRTLKGKYDSEVPRLHQELRELRQQMLSSRQPEFEPGALTETKAQELFKGILSDEEMDALGTDALTLYAKLAGGIASKLDSQRYDNIAAELKTVKEQQFETKLGGVWDRVESIRPGARDVNDNDPGWADFLDGVEPLSGVSYREIGERAIQSGDAARIVALMDLYAGEDTQEEVVRERPVVKPSQSSSTSTARVTAPKVKSSIRESDIPAFYEAVRRGDYRGKDDERAARESEIESAVAEGRVVAG